MARRKGDKRRDSRARTVPAARDSVVSSARSLQCASGLALAATIVFFNSLRNPFVIDDRYSIVSNASITRLTALGTVLGRVANAPVGGRPLVNLSFALNYALGGLNPVGYHLLNLAIHIAAGLVLFGVVRRTLRLPGFGGEPAATGVAFASVLLWLIHPLQTEVMDYTTQRTESLMGLFYGLTVYSVIRAAHERRVVWQWCAVASCACGMASKEVMVTAPVLVLLYDRLFLAGSFGAAWRLRKWLYVALFGTWFVLLGVNLHNPRQASVGSFHDVYMYVLNQGWAIIHYLQLAIWPRGLVIDYGPLRALQLSQVLPQIAILTVLLAATAVAIPLWPAVGFLAVAFFVILLPTSSILPIVSEAAAERRMYLPLLPVLVGAVLGARSVLGRARQTRDWPRSAVNRIGWTLLFLVAFGYGVLTAQRNAEYRSERVLWQTVIERCPHARAYAGLAFINDQEGNSESGDALYNEAIKAGDVNPQTRWNLAQSLAEKGDLAGAIEQYRQFVQLQPNSAEGHFALGHTLVAAGSTADAIPHLQRALELDPGLEDPHATLGVIALQGGDFSRAVSEFQAFLAIQPDDATVNKDLGLALMGEHRINEAIAAFRQALALDPTIEDAQRGLDLALKSEALGH